MGLARVLRRGAIAGLVAGAVSGAPSTLLVREPVEAVRAAGTLLGAPTVPRGVAAHVAISGAWGVVLTLGLGRRPSPWRGAAAGAAIALLDLGVVGRRVARIAALPQVPQVLDHLAFGATVAWWLRRH